MCADVFSCGQYLTLAHTRHNNKRGIALQTLEHHDFVLGYLSMFFFHGCVIYTSISSLPPALYQL